MAFTFRMPNLHPADYTIAKKHSKSLGLSFWHLLILGLRLIDTLEKNNPENTEYQRIISEVRLLEPWKPGEKLDRA